VVVLFALPLASVRGQPVPAPSGRNLGGRYKVSGYTLELDGDRGAVQRVLAFYPFTDNKSVYIDRVTYGRVDSR
jgi:hypothetical protein